SSRSRIDLKNGVELILLVGEHLLQLEFLDGVFSLEELGFQFLFGYLFHTVEFIQHFEILDFLVQAFKRSSPGFSGLDLFHGFFGFFRIVPKVCLGRYGLKVLDLYFLTIVVKDTSSKPMCGLSSLSVVLKSSV